MKKEFLIDRQGKQFALYAGLLDLAHEKGLKSIETTIVQIPTDENGKVAICTAVATFEKDAQTRTFTGIGDASERNVAPPMRNCLLRFAETRAKARALRDAVNIGVSAFEELDDEVEAQPKPSLKLQSTPPPQEETAKETAPNSPTETAASAKACFCEKARNLGYSGHIGQLAVTLLGHKPDRWTAQTWLDATEKTATEWDAALLLLREPAETQPQSDPVDARASREEALIANLQSFFGAQRLEEGIQKVSALLRKDILSYAEVANISDVELGRLEKWLADARLNEGAKAA